MIKGFGVDMCNENRFLEKLDSRGFLDCIFHERELSFMTKNFFDIQGCSAYLAGVWAAKESFVKALGSGIFEVPLKELVLMKHENGAPFWFFSERICKLLHSHNIESTHVSLSHESGLVIAVTVLES